MLSQIIKDMQERENLSQLQYLASVQERIAYQILILADKFGIQKEDGIHLSLRLTRNELAQLAGTINESLSRHLTELKSEGIVDLVGKSIIVKNRQALMEKSGNFKA
jgi:CRP-like cAMP-binding protein